MARLAALAALTAVAAALAGCGGSGGREVAAEPIAFEQLSTAARASSEVTSGRFSFGLEATTAGADEPFSFSGVGAFDSRAEQASFSVDLSSFASLLGGLFAGFGGGPVPDLGDPDAWKIDVLRDRSVTYFRFPAIAGELPAGKSWVRVEAGQTATVGGFDFGEFERFTDANPQELLELLRGVAGEVEAVGTESLRGVETARYRATLDAASLEQPTPGDGGGDFRGLADQLVEGTGVAEAPLDVWIGADGLVRKLQLEVTGAPQGGSEPSRVVMSFELWDLGEPVAIGLPPDNEVVDASRLQR